MIDRYDDLVIYCPHLGGNVPFRYCRIVDEDLPCRRIVVCWEFRVEIGKFLEESYPTLGIQRALAAPTRSRLETILEIAEKAKSLNREEGNGC